MTMQELPRFLVFVHREDELRAGAVAEHLGLPLLFSPERIPEELYLLLDERGLSLCRGALCVRGDFSSLSRRILPGNLDGEMLVRAVRGKRAAEGLTVVDATAGLGEDSFLLAAAGCEVTLCERDRVIFSLLSDTVERARQAGFSDIVARMHLYEGDSMELLGKLDTPPDVVFLDPMFPAREKSAQVKKKFQLIHSLEQPCDVEEQLLSAAIAARPKKIVIKRPKKGPFLAGRTPSYTIDGKAVRYDCIVLS